MSWVAAAAAGGAIVSGYMGSQASKKAGQQQADAADKATELQERQYQQSRQDSMPWMQSGSDALNMMRQRMGLAPIANQFTPQAQAAQRQAQQQQVAAPTREDIYRELQGQYTSNPQQQGTAGFMSRGDDAGQMGASVVDQAGLDAAVNARMAQMAQAQPANGPAASAMRQQGQMTAGMQTLPGQGQVGAPSQGGAPGGQMVGNFGMTAGAGQPMQANGQPGQATGLSGFVAPQDRLSQAQARPTSAQTTLEMDPGYQFRLEQGQKALENSAAARGGLLSGRMAKDLAGYSQGMASQEYGNAFDRLMKLDAREWDQNATLDNRDYGRSWEQDQTGYNRLASMAGMGQTQTNNNAQLGANMSATAGQNMMSGAAANAAGGVGAANAWANAAQSGINAYQDNRMMDLYSKRTAGAGGAGSTPGFYGVGGNPY